jgi:hypothetical protein
MLDHLQQDPAIDWICRHQEQLGARAHSPFAHSELTSRQFVPIVSRLRSFLETN